MTMLLAHPAAEDLGRFVEGTLPDNERGEVVAHIADCDECRILVVDSAEFIEPAKKESPRWWAAVAASILILAGGGYFWQQSRDPLAPVIEASAQLPNRPIEPRLTKFTYLPRNTMRGSGDEEVNIPATLVESRAGEIIERSNNATRAVASRGDDPKVLHALGVAHLLTAALARNEDVKNIRIERIMAIVDLESAAKREPTNVSYQNDAAAALLCTGDPRQRQLAIAHLDKALLLDPRSPEALFNRAIALRDAKSREAVPAFSRYLEVDSTSKWADEARSNLDLLQPLPLP